MDLAEVRVGDPERERTVELLRDHCLQGRLDMDEFEERVSGRTPR